MRYDYFFAVLNFKVMLSLLDRYLYNLYDFKLAVGLPASCNKECTVKCMLT